jgi:hypothetical protein
LLETCPLGFPPQRLTIENFADSGCGLLGIMTALLGASVVFTNPSEVIPLLKGNIALNCGENTHQIREFNWYGSLLALAIPISE